MPSPSDSLQRMLPIAILAVSVLTVPVLLLAPDGLPRYRALRAELDRVSSENETLRRDVAHLRVEVQRLRDDPSAVEHIARDQLGMVRQDEVVFQFAPADRE